MSGEAGASLWNPCPQADKGDRQSFHRARGPPSASLQLSSLLWPQPLCWSPCGGVHLPDPQFPPYPPQNDSSWKMSVSPQNHASTRTSVSLRSLACSACLPAATDIEGYPPAQPGATGVTGEARELHLQGPEPPEGAERLSCGAPSVPPLQRWHAGTQYLCPAAHGSVRSAPPTGATLTANGRGGGAAETERTASWASPWPGAAGQGRVAAQTG